MPESCPPGCSLRPPRRSPELHLSSAPSYPDKTRWPARRSPLLLQPLQSTAGRHECLQTGRCSCNESACLAMTSSRPCGLDRERNGAVRLATSEILLCQHPRALRIGAGSEVELRGRTPRRDRRTPVDDEPGATRSAAARERSRASRAPDRRSERAILQAARVPWVRHSTLRRAPGAPSRMPGRRVRLRARRDECSPSQTQVDD